MMSEPSDGDGTGALDLLLAAALRDEPVPWSRVERATPPLRSPIDRIRFHGIAAALVDNHACSDWSRLVRDEIVEEARAQHIWEELHRRILAGVCADFAKVGVDALLIKGTALAYSVYPTPALRRRGDTDLVVKRSDLRKSRERLAAAGFAPEPGEGVFQESWSVRTPFGAVHTIDLHWQLTDYGALAELLPLHDAFSHSQPLGDAFAGAVRIDAALSIVLNAINRISHDRIGYFVENVLHHDGRRLIWTLDLHYLMLAMDRADWDRLLSLARASGLAGLVLPVLQEAEALLQSPFPADVRSELAAMGGSERIKDYLRKPSAADRLPADLRSALPLREKARLLKIRCFPSRSEIEKRYGTGSRWKLPFFYAVRLARGIRKQLTGTA